MGIAVFHGDPILHKVRDMHSASPKIGPPSTVEEATACHCLPHLTKNSLKFVSCIKTWSTLFCITISNMEENTPQHALSYGRSQGHSMYMGLGALFNKPKKFLLKNRQENELSF